MSDKWEVVVGSGRPRKPRPENGQVKPVAKPVAVVTGTSQKPVKRKKHIGPRDSKVAKLPGSDDEFDETLLKAAPAPKQEAAKPKKQVSKQQIVKPKETKPRDLESALKNVPPEQLKSFYDELINAGSIGDVYLSWIKYSADALNTTLHQVQTPDSSQWPNNLSFPNIPKGIESIIHYIITQTAASREDVDVIGLSFSSLIASLPTLLLRGDAAWGYLLFLREMCKIDPELPIRKSKTLSELMESYGNRKEVGICILWISAQASLYSDNVLKIVSDHILPFHSFKHYKNFVLSVLSTLADSSVMSGDNVVEPDEFEDFFEICFDPKKRRDFENFYPKIRNLALANLRDDAEILFFRFLGKLGEKTFMPLSAYGQEVFEVLHGCLANDSSLVDKWRVEFHNNLKESAILLNYLSKHPGDIQYGKKLESDLIQTDEFAEAAVKTPDLIRIAKKLQTGFKKIEASRKRFSWKMGCLVILLLLGGIFYLDVTENGKGAFAKSQTGEFLESYGLLDEAMLGINFSRDIAIKVIDLGSKLLWNIYEGIRPMLQIIDKQIQVYIPEIINYGKILWNYLNEIGNLIFRFLQEKVFVGVLSPESIRKVVKDSLTFIWTNVSYAILKLYELIEDWIRKQD